MDRKKYQIFSYDELQDENIQLLLFSKTIKKQNAFLRNYGVYKDSQEDKFLLRESGSLVKGSILSLTKKQLLIYEQWMHVPKYSKYLKKVFLEEDKDSMYVFVYDKKPEGEILKKENLKFKNPDEYINFLNDVKEFAKQINRKRHELHFTDICIEFEIKSDQIFQRISKSEKINHENEKINKIMTSIFKEYGINKKIPIILEARTILMDKVVEFKIIIEQYTNNLCHIFMYFNAQTTTLHAISQLISNLNIDVYDDGKRKNFALLLDFLGVSIDKLFLKKVYLHPFNYFDFNILKGFTKYYPTFVLKNKYSIWYIERFEYIFKHIIETRLKFY